MRPYTCMHGYNIDVDMRVWLDYFFLHIGKIDIQFVLLHLYVFEW